ncbi:UNVERIFIED_CONTAM: hypothetical protein GTU68_016149 [Idotea baltica]|nr:hypothetical protein [Idotea baltica]
MPKMGESIMEATIIKWIKNVGDTVDMDETILEIATDKVDSEIPSPVAGTISEILFKEDDVVEVGKVIAVIATDGEEVAPTPAVADPTPEPTVSTSTENGKAVQTKAVSSSAQNIANTAAPSNVTPIKSVAGGDEIVAMDRMRKLIADHMVMSKHTSPHVTSFVEADVTNLVNWRNKVKLDFQKNHGEKITFTPIFIEAVAKAIRDFPMINVTVDGNNIIVKKDINIGMAAALPTGNLIVPVIKNADQLNLMGLTKSVNNLAGRARANQLKPDEIQGGTFTITNVGTFGNVMGTPIINQPQVAILAVGAIRKKPAVLETEHGDVIAIRNMMFLSLSYDHRVVDGFLGGSFLRKIADYLEDFDVNQSV